LHWLLAWYFQTKPHCPVIPGVH